jgi:tRNA U38,U39,U40 pseudouridine synthase TruA
MLGLCLKSNIERAVQLKRFLHQLLNKPSSFISVLYRLLNHFLQQRTQVEVYKRILQEQRFHEDANRYKGLHAFVYLNAFADQQELSVRERSSLEVLD